MDHLFPLLQLRWRMTVRGLKRGPEQIAELLARVLLLLAFCVIGVGGGVGLAILFHFLLASGEASTFRVALHMAFFVFSLAGFFFPLLEATANPSLDAQRYLRFPISIRRLFLLQLSLSALGSAHLMYMPSLVGIFVGVFLFSGAAALPAAAILLLFFLAMLVWTQAAMSLLQVALRIRRMREVVGVTVMLVMIGWWFFQIRTFGGAESDIDMRITGMRDVFLRFHERLPSGWAAEGLLAARAGDGRPVAQALLLLAGLVVAGGLVAYSAFRVQLFSVGFGGTPVRRRGAGGGKGLSRWAGVEIPFLHATTAAVFRKELLYIFRSAVGKYSFVMVPVFLAGIGFLVESKFSEPVWGYRPADLIFPGLVFYASLVTNNLVLNGFAWEGPGVQSYFLSPVALRRVLLGKNLAFWLYACGVAATGVITLLLFVFRPGVVVLVSSIELFVLLMILFALCGNLTSVLLPVRRDMSNVWKNPPQGMAIMILMGSSSFVLGLVVLLALVLTVLNLQILLPFALLALILVAAVAYALALGPTASLMNRRREAFIAALTEKVQ